MAKDTSKQQVNGSNGNTPIEDQAPETISPRNRVCVKRTKKNDNSSRCKCRCLRLKRISPTIFSLIIPLSYVALVFIFFWSSDEQWLRTLLLSILLLPLWFLFSYLLFPRIVVTIMDIDNVKDSNQLYLLADGKEIYKYKEADPTSLPIQFSFQVWRRGKYQLCLKGKQNGEIKPDIKEANTYEHTVCHVTFSKEDKQQGKDKES